MVEQVPLKDEVQGSIPCAGTIVRRVDVARNRSERAPTGGRKRPVAKPAEGGLSEAVSKRGEPEFILSEAKGAIASEGPFDKASVAQLMYLGKHYDG